MTSPHYHSHVDSADAVGGRLKEARLKAGLSQRQLAFPGCSAAYISRLEAGERVPSLQLLRKLALKLDADEEYLATGTASGPKLPAELVEADVALRLDDLQLASQLYERVLQTTADRRVRAEAVGGLGRLAFRNGDPRSAIDGIEEALRLAPELMVASPSLVETLARAYANANELESAIGILERSIAAAEEAEEAAAATRLRILLANALIDSQSFGRAEELLGKVLALSAELLDPAQRARVLWSQSRLHTMRGNQEGAARYARRALELLELGEDTYALARAHQALAYIEVEREHPHEALELLARGTELLGTDVSPIERAKFRLEEARALAQLGQHEEAAAAALAAKALFGDAQPVDAGRAFLVVGDVFQQLGETERAREIWELALELLELEPNPWAADAYERLGRLLEDEGKTDEALAMLKRALGVRERSNAH
ncbi:MAG TPA: tetratricopeptide repeat protein [Gaiellaceae bacterium]|nr:tetratricopeptide repeat protein [Gaiellaceae bacterium]